MVSIDWASIWLIQNADNPKVYHAVRYCRECTVSSPEGLHQDKPAGRRWGAQFGTNYILAYNDEAHCWIYTGRGVTLSFPTESDLFFPLNAHGY